MPETDAYTEALQSGQYEKPGGIIGKYDNVRRFWEDEQLGLYLRPYLEQLVALRKSEGRKLRIMDLGCGSGDGSELINSIRSEKSPLSEHDAAVVPADMVEHYKGVDVNEGLLGQARALYGNVATMDFCRADINTMDLSGEPPYDLYMANYGTLSHNTDEQTISLLTRIARHSRPGTLILIDWLGRFCYEWQTLWTHDWEQTKCMDYVISYIYSPTQKKAYDLTSFPLRIVGRSEVLRIYRQARKGTGGRIALRKLADRSSFVGRHMDTAQYNPFCQPLRQQANSLFEPNVSTDIDKLFIRYVPKQGFAEVNSYHQQLADAWNHLLLYTKALLAGSTPPTPPQGMPTASKRATATMQRIMTVARRTSIGNPRSSIVEPQLGYCLRHLEMELQKGLGCGHGLVAIFEISN